MILSHTSGVGLESARVKGHSSGIPRSHRRHRDRHGSIVSQACLLHTHRPAHTSVVPPHLACIVSQACLRHTHRQAHTSVVPPHLACIVSQTCLLHTQASPHQCRTTTSSCVPSYRESNYSSCMLAVHVSLVSRPSQTHVTSREKRWQALSYFSIFQFFNFSIFQFFKGRAYK